LHVLGLGAAATGGFTLAARPHEDARIGIAVTDRREPLPEVVEPVAREELPTIDVVWPEVVPEEWESLEPVAPEYLSSLPDFAPQPELEDDVVIPFDSSFLMPRFDIGVLERKVPGAAGSGSGREGLSAGGGVASLGSGGASGLGPGLSGRGGSGTGLAGTGDGAGTGNGLLAVPRAPVIRAAVTVEAPRPVYPLLARRAREEGSVLCLLHVSEEGLVTAVEVLESSGHARLDDAAREALARWRFQPRRVDGRPVASTLRHRVTFHLEP
jgi:protein TonB